MAIKKVKFPNNSVVEIQDSRITGVDNTPTSGSGNVVTSGGVYSHTVSELGTSGNNLTWTKNGSTNNITVPYAASAGSATKVGTATVGSSVRPIYLNAGTPTAITKVATDYIGWTSTDHDGLTSIENLFYTSGTNAFAYLNTAQVDVEYSNDGGATWVDYGLTSAEKVSVFTYSGAFRIGNKTTNYTTNDSVRVTIHAGCGVYCKSEFLVIRHFFPGATELKIEGTTYAAQDTYEVLNTIRCSGNPGFRVIPLSAYLFGNNGIHDLRITATYVGPRYPTVGHSIAEIRLYASNVYSYPSNYAKYRHLYSIDAEQNAIFPNDIRPQNNNISELGTSSYRWANVYSVLGNFSGALTASSTLSVGGTFRVLNSGGDGYAKLLVYPSNPYGIVFKSSSNGTMTIQSQRESNDNETYPLVLNPSGGNVGVGTSSPSQKLEIGGNVKATSFIKSGGTSSQFLKADGSVDSNTYVKTSQLPAAPGTLITNATTSQTASSGEALSGNITLHKVSKTGSYNDLLDKPAIPTITAITNAEIDTIMAS